MGIKDTIDVEKEALIRSVDDSKEVTNETKSKDKVEEIKSYDVYMDIKNKQETTHQTISQESGENLHIHNPVVCKNLSEFSAVEEFIQSEEITLISDRKPS